AYNYTQPFVHIFLNGKGVKLSAKNTKTLFALIQRGWNYRMAVPFFGVKARKNEPPCQRGSLKAK
ncbi:MAG: hypothetical protein LBP78_04640, partial [Acidaminococcales bacterium]|nr:hypothetical protein [Acidaminococcales bacterium]